MILATYRDNAYDVVLLIHILSFLVAFAPAVINPLLGAYFEKHGGDPVLRTWSHFSADFTQKFALPALGVLLITGILMIVMSDEVIEFSDTWISLAFLVWLAIGGVVSAVILKGEKRVAEGDMAGMDMIKKVGGPVGTVLMVVMLYLMIFQPGA